MNDMWFNLYRKRDARCLDYAEAYGTLTATVRLLASGKITPERALANLVTCEQFLAASAAPAARNLPDAYEAGVGDREITR